MQKEKNLKQIYESMLGTLRKVTDINDKLPYYRTLDFTTWSDNDFFETLIRTVFTGIRNNIIADRWPAITKAFSNFNIHKVAKYKEKDVKRLMKNKKIIRHEGRIRATIENAKKMEEIIKEYNSFANYLKSFSMDDLIEKLQGYYGGFKRIGEVNIYEFAKEIGLPFIKPDINVKRVLFRLGLIEEKATSEEIVEIGKAIAEAVNEKTGVIDWVLWSFGNKVCSTTKPSCDKCLLTKFCTFL